MAALLPSCSITNTTILCGGKLIQYYSHLSTPIFGTLENCSGPCNGAFFSQEQVDILQYTKLTLSCLGIISACIILFTYIANYCKIRHPEAPIFYIAGLQLLISLMHLISGVYGSFASVYDTNASSSEGLHCDSRYKNHYNESMLLQNGTENPFCITVFAILYYSTLSVLSWWTVLTIEWLLATIKRKQVKRKYLFIISHVTGWSAPLPFLFMAAYLNAISGSTTEMTCWISRRNDDHYQLGFIILPLSLTLTLNGILLLIGFCIGCKKARQLRISSRNDEVTIPQLARVSVYSVLQFTVSDLLLMSYMHQYWYQRDAEIKYLQFIVHRHVPSCYTQASDNHILFFIIAILQILCSQIVGVALLLWILRRELLCRCKCEHRNNNNNNNNNNLNVTITSRSSAGAVSLVTYTSQKN